jgi:hypothetical protein
MEKTSFDGFSKEHPAVVGGILDSIKLAAIFARLEPAELLYLEHSAGDSPSDLSRQSGHPASIHCRGMGQAGRGIHPQDLPLILLAPVSHC